MRSIAMFGALAVFAAAPMAAQGKFRTGDINPSGPRPTGSTTTTGQVLGDIIGRDTQAQNGNWKSDHIPPGQRPPAGMCRIWIDGVPPGQQPAPTDCQTAVATKPANARVLWGDESAFPGKGNGKFKNKQKGHDGDDREDNRVMRGGRTGVLGSAIPSTNRQQPNRGQKGKKGKGGG
jgi:hypothetical protein